MSMPDNHWKAWFHHRVSGGRQPGCSRRDVSGHVPPAPRRPVFLPLLALLGLTAVQAAPEGPGLGKPLGPEEIATLDGNIFPDGRGLPPGQGTAAEGKPIYAAQCAACHGPAGTGGSAGELAGRSALDGPHPDQTVGNYWPYATTIFDFVRRSMPLNAPRSLSDEQVYAVTAYLLHINGIIAESAEMNATTLAKVRMPNREGFVQVWPNRQ